MTGSTRSTWRSRTMTRKLAAAILACGLATLLVVGAANGATPTPQAATPTPRPATPTPQAEATPRPDRFEVFIPNSLLHGPVQQPAGGEPALDFADQAGTIRAYANGEFCASVQVAGTRAAAAAGAPSPVIELGGPNQPAACRTNGARVTFTISPPELRGQEIPVQQTLALRRGTRVTLDRLTIPPVDTGDGAPPLSALPATGGPPSTGGSGSGGYLLWGGLAAGAAALLVLLATSFSKGRRKGAS
jgi:hypothetical protein